GRSVFDPEAQRALAIALARVAEERLGDAERAVAAYRRALDLPGDEAVPVAALERLLGARLAADPGNARRARDLADRPERAIAGGGPGEAAPAERSFRLGELRRGPLADPDGALAAYREVLERSPRHPGLRAALEALVASGAPPAGALELLEP